MSDSSSRFTVLKAQAQAFRKILSRKLTLMVVPHTTFRPINLQFSFSFMLFLFVLWTSLTSWATWAVVSNIDYWSMKTDHQIMKLKVHFFVKELQKNRELVDQVRQADLQLRQLLGMKSRKNIVQGRDDGQGGAQVFEQSILQKELTHRLWEVTEREVSSVSAALVKESMQTLESYKEISEQIGYERGLFRSTPKGWPALGRTTSRFGRRVHPMTGDPEFHCGIDIANSPGTPVRATADGMVLVATWQGGYGKLVVINHGFNLCTYYGHNSKLLVNAGDKVVRGQIIANMGSTGSSTGDHCHYEIWQNGQPINPWPYLVTGPVPEDKTTTVVSDITH